MGKSKRKNKVQKFISYVEVPESERKAVLKQLDKEKKAAWKRNKELLKTKRNKFLKGLKTQSKDYKKEET